MARVSGFMVSIRIKVKGGIAILHTYQHIRRKNLQQGHHERQSFGYE